MESEIVHAVGGGIAVVGVEEHPVRQRLDPPGEAVDAALQVAREFGAEPELDHLTRRVAPDELERRALGDDSALVHHDEPIAQLLGLVHVVRRQHERDAPLLQPEEPIPDHVSCLGVEPGRRLVEQQDVRIADEGTGDREPPLHSAGERLDARLRALVQLDELEQLVYPLPELAAGDAEVPPVDRHVLTHRQLEVERVLLRDDAEPRADLGPVLLGIETENAERPARRWGDAADHAHRRALARAVRPEEAERLALLHVKVDPVDGDEVVEALHQTAGMDQWRLPGDVHTPQPTRAVGDKKEADSVRAMQAAVAAGHRATTAAGIEMLEAGGSAADAAVASVLASCVAETVMTGLLGGGHAVYWDATSGRARNLDCFVDVPGLGAERREAELVHLAVPFGEELVHYAVGAASCASPGLPAGLEALWRAYGRLPWAELVAPALRLARDGVEVPEAHAACLAMLAPVMTMDAGARIYSPGGELLQTGSTLEQPGLVAALEAIASEGAASAYRGTIADALIQLSEDRGGRLTRADLESYEPQWWEPVRARYLEWTLFTRADLSGVPETVASFPRLRGLDEKDRVLALVDVFRDEGVENHTTNTTVVDAAGNACVVTTSLGLGSGDFLPGLDLHLNSMLGEVDLVRGPLEPGQRMSSMMAPTLAFSDGRLELAAGAAGGTRLRTALLGVLAGILDEGLEPRAAVERARFHPARGTVNAEPGVNEDALAELERQGWSVRRWPARHHYFGGVSVVSRRGAAADPRRSGAAATVR